jgi:large subunit ribosomal protein L35
MKLKTNKAFKKRFRVTKNGKVLACKTLRRHMLADRSTKKKRQARGMQVIDPSDVNRVKKSLPYG